MNPTTEESLYNHEDYERIAQAIAFMREHHLYQPDLPTIAEYVNLEAMSPGEFKTGGVGLQIWYGIHDTPFGKSLIATTPRGICNLYFLDGMDEENAAQTLHQEWKNAEIICDYRVTQEISDRIFNPSALNSGKPLVLFVKGTNFQIQVWRGLLKIPFGSITTYQSLAAAIGRPTAARAVGNAVGSNPVSYLIPCHRVIRESGELGGYRWGIKCKTSILGWEASIKRMKDVRAASPIGEG